MESPRATEGQDATPTDGIGTNLMKQQAGGLALPRRVLSALEILLEAHRYAQDLQHGDWDFAVEMAQLRGMGLTDNDFRWLVGKKLVAHGREITVPSESQRSFQFPKMLEFSDTTCFVLTEAGIAYAEQSLCEAEKSAISKSRALERGLEMGVHTNGVPQDSPGRAGGVGIAGAIAPKWDRDRQQLRVNSSIVKQFKVPAPNQEAILAAFEEEDWPPRIDDPLSPIGDQDPKRRLHDTINSLNRNQKTPLVRFLGDGSGQGVRWEFANQVTVATSDRKSESRVHRPAIDSGPAPPVDYSSV
jgi:hypothetical protein